MEPVFAFPIVLPPRGSRLRLRSLHEQLRAAIAEGRLQPGLRMPGTREVAAAYGISRNTALAAYDLLLSEGYLVTRPRSGAFVAAAVPRRRVAPDPALDDGADRRLNAFWRAPPAFMPAAMRVTSTIDFRLGVADKGLFPFDTWRRLAARATRAYAGEPAVYGSAQGRPALREAIAQHVAFARAVVCRPDDVVVTSGSQQAFDLLARILVTPGRTVVAVENPGYPPLRAVLAGLGAKIAPVPTDAEGMIVDRIPADAKVVCVTPSHQFPLGTALSMQRRAALLDFARRRGAVVLEDDYDGEFGYRSRPLDAMQSLDSTGCVFYVGTFTKTLFPGMRLGFVVAPPWARRALVHAKLCADMHCSVIEQETLAAFIADGHMARHVRRMRRVYASRRGVLLDGLHAAFGRWLQPVPSYAGLHVSALARAGVNTDAIAARARDADVGVYSLRPYCLAGRPRHGLLFGYGAIDEAQIREGLRRLRPLFAS
ncbi:MAG TPA: PLP-dependent aminotransferase family protein [Casimicrobiaceae bacterium]|nr:PLP-dependent aminotransferase family protein [Casimicrobiaceae bacterium]